jgi:perosamine synthetase
MTNLQAAIGLAQVERVDWQLERRREVVSWYREELDGADGITWQQERDWARHVWWMFTAVFGDEFGSDRDAVSAQLQKQGIETRRVVYPMHQLPPYQDAARREQFPVADRLAARGLNLPTWAGVTREDVHFICRSLLESRRRREAAARLA